ncbi:unnamed protein product [Laminaria digitata]
MARPVERVDCLVVGAGVVGMAVARALALKGREVLVCEKERAVGQGTTSRNSEVIHAGLYYKPGSLKARFCVRGREALYRYCSERGVPHRRCGKLVVASSYLQLPALRDLHKRAEACGVEDVRMVGAEEAREMEPEVLCTEALLSTSTGIVDSHALTLALQGDAEAHGAVVSLLTPVHAAQVLPDGAISASVVGMDLHCRTMVNCSGLSAVDLAGRVQGCTLSSVPQAFFAKGNYFRYTGSCPFRRLVYPLPEPNQAGLGVHATIDLAGQVKFGPDVEWVPRPTDQAGAFDADEFDYSVDPGRSAEFSKAIRRRERRYWPAVDESKLVPDYSGIRPKLSGPGGAPTADALRRNDVDEVREPGCFVGAADFAIQGAAVHGVPGLVNLLGIESPGLTASLAIGDHVADLSEREK